ncbi:hypothetical protein B5F77_12890 [Parabacteroides sp. An277]|uniref:putative Ig domain-containing protein n=1 Tax=Parabacteroides sp. An277 TaxID=1965619 RepID=UPI000B376026|nr:putative Ig domain-containing protein [Parabacteroides sp. An277]OUO50409.1 hypothetical protein B5F77_12890 [Parabacteroides sp. An277]
MKKILTLLLVYVLTPFIARGQEDATYSINKENVSITEAGTYIITGTGEKTENNIRVTANGTVNITIENVNIESGEAPLNIESGNVRLTLRGTNRLIARPDSWNQAGIRVPKEASLEITKESEGHSLTAKGSVNDYGGAGIGANTNEIAGAITINGGNLDITGGDMASAIGGGSTYSKEKPGITPEATSITINGGVIIAQLIDNYNLSAPAAIGTGVSIFDSETETKVGTIKITGGTVIANNGKGLIGHAGDGSTGSITITGGNISATSCAITPKNESGIDLVKKEITCLTPYTKVTALSGAEGYSTNDMYADRERKLHLWLPSDANPSVQAYIAPTEIALTVNKDGETWDEHGKIFSYQTEGGEVMAMVFGKFYPEDDKEYTVYDGENATNAVVSKNNPNATLNYYTVTYDGNGSTAGTVPTDDGIYLSGSEVTLAKQGDLVRTYYTFKGWGATADATEPIETSFNIDKKTTLYALWTLNTFTLMEGEIPEFTYGTAIENINLSEWLSDDAEANCGEITFSLKEGSSLPAGLTLSEEGILSGTPTAANENGVKVIIVATAENGSTAEIVITITVKKADPAYAVPTGLTATYGQTLADVALPEAENGTWQWQAEDTPVGAAGENTFTAIFTPADTDNYKIVEVNVTITVSQAILSDNQMTLEGDEDTIFELGDEGTILTATITGITDAENAKYWKWESSNINVATVEKLTPLVTTRAANEERTSTAKVTPVGEGKATITVTYTSPNYTGTLTYSIEVKAKEEPDPDPTPQPDPDPIYYNIYLDDVCEGVEASLSRGVVKEGNQVSVYVEVEEGYDAENLKVSFKRSLYGYWEEVEEGVQPGEYIIYNVYSDIYVKVEGAEKIEEPTGMEDIEGAKVYAQDGNLYVYTSQPQEVTIITMNGAIVKRERQEGWRSYSLPKGIYIIGIGEERMKIRN